MIDIIRIDGFERLGDLGSNLELLVDRARMGPAHRLDWIETLYRVGGEGIPLELSSLSTENRIVGFLAFVIRSQRWNGVRVRQLVPLSLLNQLHGTQFVLDESFLEEGVAVAIEHIGRNISGWDYWTTYGLSDEPQTQVLERELSRQGYRYTKKAAPGSPYLTLPKSWDLLQAQLQSRFRTTIRSRERAIRQLGSVTLRVLRRPADVAKALGEIEQIETASWKQTNGLPITHQKHWEFYRQYAVRAAERQTLVVALLELAGEPIAFDYSVYEAGVYYLLQTSYKQQYKDKFPGLILRKLMTEWLINQGALEVDFGTGESEWKSKWTQSVRAHTQYTIFSGTTKGVGMALGSALKGVWRKIGSREKV